MFCKSMLALLLAGGMCASCDSVFDVHPYDVNVHGDNAVNASNMEQIERNTHGKDTIRFAFISDSHQWLDDLDDEIRSINGHDSIDFVVHGGDLTDFGATKEFEWTRDYLKRLKVPFVCVLGNHDCLGTGTQTYQVVFGPTNFSFIAGRVKFVCLNTNAIEYDYSEPVPDFDFMEAQVAERASEYDHTVCCMHAKPNTEQFNNNVSKVFNYYVTKFPDVLFCLNGHGHHNYQEDIFGNGIVYYEVGAAKFRKYYIFTITPKGYQYEVVDF